MDRYCTPGQTGAYTIFTANNENKNYFLANSGGTLLTQRNIPLSTFFTPISGYVNINHSGTRTYFMNTANDWTQVPIKLSYTEGYWAYIDGSYTNGYNQNKKINYVLNYTTWVTESGKKNLRDLTFQSRYKLPENPWGYDFKYSALSEDWTGSIKKYVQIQKHSGSNDYAFSNASNDIGNKSASYEFTNIPAGSFYSTLSLSELQSRGLNITQSPQYQ
jgi:hypothetical protein